MSRKILKTVSLDEVTDKYIGKKGTAARQTFEDKLRLDFIGKTTTKNRKRNLM